ncbi:uncharacterized protein [Diadema antillarum]|uniref:uncharacterized protein n=1 Tax=Diadema antillarum TaxID=105358 RepID=UPI003A87B3F4
MSVSEKREEVPPPPIPEGCRPLSHQVAGHIYGKCQTRAGLLQDDYGSILKLLQTNNRGTREKKFYQMVFGEDQSDPLLLSARNLVAPFKGTVVSAEDPSVEYIKLGDMTAGFSHPCIMDVKIGRIGYEDGVNSKKAQTAKLKYPHMDKLGFQILGMRIYHPLSKRYSQYDKKYGRSLDVTSMIEGLAKFFNVEEQIRTDIMYSFLVRLQQILDWFQVQTCYHFYSSSLLFIYEADTYYRDMLKPPTPPLPHSTPPTNGTDRTRDCATPLNSEKPETYPLKRKKMRREGDRESSSQSTRHFDNGVVIVGEEGDSVCSRDVDVQSNSPLGGANEGKALVGTLRCNGVKSRHECDEGVTQSKSGKPSCQDDPSKSSSTPRMQACERDSSVNGPVSESLLNHSHSTRSARTSHESRCDTNSSVQNQSAAQAREPPDGSSPTRERRNPPPVEVRMIDFAHAIESTTRDENYIFGLKMLMQYIETLHDCTVG